MRILKILLLTLTACFGLSGCMQHNGRIGDWFGTWKLESLEINGIEDPDYLHNVFFQFQTNVVRIVEVNTQVSTKYAECFGDWSDNGSTLTLNFGHTADNNPALFIPPTITRLARGENILTVSHESSRSMTWTFNDPASDATITYRLHKQ